VSLGKETGGGLRADVGSNTFGMWTICDMENGILMGGGGGGNAVVVYLCTGGLADAVKRRCTCSWR
jgi:hypothetical protein